MTMSELSRPIENATVVDKAKQTYRSMVPWLDDFECPECGAICKPEHSYDPQTASFYAESNGVRPTYHCEECDIHYRRDEESGVSFSPFRD